MKYPEKLVKIIFKIFLNFSFLLSIHYLSSEVKYQKIDRLERWYEVFLGNSKVGHAHSLIQEINHTVLSQTIFEFSIKRAGDLIKISTEEKTEETIDGKILGFSSKIKMSDVPVIKKGWVIEDDIFIQENHFSQKVIKKYGLDKDGLMTWGFIKFIRDQGFKKERKDASAKIYSADFGMEKPTPALVKFLGETTLKINGIDKKAYGLKISLKSAKGNFNTFSWLDEEGYAIKTSMHLNGMPIEIIESSKEKALVKINSNDFLMNSLIPINKEIPNNSRYVEFRLTSNNESLQKNFYQNRHQKVERINSKNLMIKISNEDWRKKESYKTIIPNYEFLKPNPMINSRDPLIQSLSRSAGKGSKNIFDLSDRLLGYSHNFINNRNFKVGFASASEVAREKQGDCTEHAVFLAALGRSMGIPSRIASGLVFFKEFKSTKNVLGFHMWTEFFLKGKWITFDSALNKIGTQTDRITFSVTSLNNSSVYEIGSEIYELIGNLNVKVEKIENY